MRDLLYVAAILVIGAGLPLGIQHGLETRDLVQGLIRFGICVAAGLLIALAADAMGRNRSNKRGKKW